MKRMTNQMDATKKFSGKAEGYEKYRPTYPKGLLDYLYQEKGFQKDSVIADIGAGTGIFSRLLLERGSHVFCVEPNNDMRRVAWQKLQEYETCTFVNATAEHTLLNDQSMDFVTAAQAFHWFDQSAFAAECRRILRPGGKVVLLWNSREKNDEMVKETYQICQMICPEFKGFSGGEETPQKYQSFFREGRYEEKIFDNDLHLNLEEFLGRYLSASYAPSKEESRYFEFTKALTGLFGSYQKGGIITLPNKTRCYIGEV